MKRISYDDSTGYFVPDSRIKKAAELFIRLNFLEVKNIELKRSLKLQQELYNSQAIRTKEYKNLAKLHQAEALRQSKEAERYRDVLIQTQGQVRRQKIEKWLYVGAALLLTISLS